VSILPPEILGSVFRWNVTSDGDFGGLPKGSHNFLLVCHHWFEVASRTPDLWSFWGNKLQDWAPHHGRCGAAPLDLVLAAPKYSNNDFDDKLRDALRDRATRDLVRRVHLKGLRVSGLLNSIISSIVTEEEGTRSSRMESFIVLSACFLPVDVSAFFSRYRLPKLRCLRLIGCKISSWDLVRSHTMALTTLELGYMKKSPALSLPQLLSVLSSNPLLRYFGLSLISGPVPDVNHSDGSSPRVPLRHLKWLRLNSDFRPAFELLNQLDLPDRMVNLRLKLFWSSPSDISRTLGMFLGDHVRRRGRLSGDRLGLLAYPSTYSFDFNVGVACKGDGSAEVTWFVEVSGSMTWELEGEEVDRVCFDLISHIPRDQVISLQTSIPILRSKELCVEMRDLTYLHLVDGDLSVWFMEPDILGPHAFKDLLPGLDHIVITGPILDSDDWSPLTKFLSHRAAAGNRISSLRLCNHPQMGRDVVKSIKRMVKVVDFGCGSP